MVELLPKLAFFTLGTDSHLQAEFATARITAQRAGCLLVHAQLILKIRQSR